MDFCELISDLNPSSTSSDGQLDHLIELAVRLVDVSLVQLRFVSDQSEWVYDSESGSTKEFDVVSPLTDLTLMEPDSPTVISDLSATERVDRNQLSTNIQSYRAYAGVPLVVEDEPIGVLCVWDRNPRDWTESDRTNLQLVADQLIDSLERREREERLREECHSLERHQKMVENLPVGVFRTKPDGQILNANPAALSIIGMDAEEELTEYNIRDIYVDRSRRTEIVEKLMEHGSVEEEEVKFYRYDGEEFWALLSLRLVQEDDEAYIDGSIRDVTRRRETQEELRTTARRLEFTTQAGGVGIWEWEVGTDDVYWDEKLKEILGQKSLSFQSFLEQIHPEDRPRVQKAIENAVEDREVYHEVFRIDHYASGEERWVEAHGEVREEPSGAMMYGIGQDVTEREETRRSLEKSEERFRTIVNNTHDIFTVVDAEGTILYESPSIEPILGYSPQKLIGDSAFDYVHPDDREEVLDVFSVLLEGEAPAFRRVECRVRDTDGDWVWLEITGHSEYQPAWDGYLMSSRDISERKQVEQALRERNQQFQHMAENVDEVFWIHDTEIDEVAYVSPAAKTIWGEPPEAFLGSSERWLNSIVEPDRERVEEHFRENFGEGFDIEYRIERPDGEIRWIHDHGYPVREDGTVIRLVGTARDITDRKQAEHELKSTIEELRQTTISRNYFENIISTMPSTVFVVNENGTIDHVNSALCDLLDYSREELVGQSLSTVFSEDPPFDVDELLDADDSGNVQNREVQYRVRNGTSVPVLFSASSLKDETSGFEGLICVGLDISERKQARAALEESERRFRQMAENINEVIFMFSGDWSELLYVNDQFEEIWNISAETVEENPLAFLEQIHPDQRQKAEEAMRKTMNGERQVREYQINKENNYQRSVITEAIPVTDENGEVIRIVGTVRDITELKQTQKELQRALDEKANLLKEVHHRVKNNMQIISSLLSLHKHTGSRDSDRMLDECQKRISSMAKIHELLYQSENFAQVAFDDYVGEIVESIVRLSEVPRSSIDLTVEVDSSLNLPLSKAVPCGLIIHELVSNACEHALREKRDNRLIVTMKRSGETVRIRVRDNGPGFPADLDPDQANSVGLEILKALSEHELGGTITFDEGSMTTVDIEFELDDGSV